MCKSGIPLKDVKSSDGTTQEFIKLLTLLMENVI